MSAELGDLFELWTPGEIGAYVANVATGYNALAADFKANNVLDGPNAKAWDLLLKNFQDFQKGTGFFSGLFLGTLRTAEQYASQLSYWRSLYQTKTGKNASGAIVAIPGDAQTTMFRTVTILAGGALVAWVGVNILQTMRKR